MSTAGSPLRGPYSTVSKETGTGAAISITTGFKPISITIHNRTQLSKAYWNAAMAADAAFLAVDSGVGTTDFSFITTGGITAGSNGFSIGTNASINTASDEIYWEATQSIY